MNEPELDRFIVKRLSEGQDFNDLVLDICNQTGMKWPEAQALVNRIHIGHRGEIAKKQSPLLVAIALTMFIGGIGILGYELFIVMTLVVNYMQIGKDPLILLDLASYFPNYVILFLEGTPIAIAMILGSLLGMSQVWSSILFHEDSSD